MSQAAKTERTCPSCSHALAGHYCSHCGEKILDAHDLTVRHFLTHTVTHELLHLDGKIWRSFRYLLFQPGRLSMEWAAGRHRLYVKPIRILITAILVYALLTRGGLQASLFVGSLTLSIAPASVPTATGIEQTVQRLDRFGILQGLIAGRETELASTTVAERFHSQLRNFVHPLSFSVVVLLSLVLFALLRRKRPLFVEHAVFSAHVFAFVLLSSLIYLAGWQLINFSQNESGPARIGAFLIILTGVFWQFCYFVAAVRRFYFGSDLRRWSPVLVSAAIALLIYIANSVLITAIQLIGGAIALQSI